MKSDIRTALIYVLVWPLAAYAGLTALFLTGAVANTFDWRPLSSALAWPAPLVPPFASGLALYAMLRRWWPPLAPQVRGLKGHVVRTVLLYVLAATLAWFTSRNASEPDFGLYAYFLLVPPLATTVGAIVADLRAIRYANSRTKPPLNGQGHLSRWAP